MMKSKAGAIHLFDDQRTTLQLAAARGVRKRTLEEINVIPGPFDLTAWPTEESESFFMPEIAEPLCRSKRPSDGHEAAAYVGVPVRSRGENLGLISVVGRPDRAFEDEDIALLTSIADQIGVVVENARLHRQAEQLAVVRERERLAR
jgi:GAF domain-containing protein